MTGLFVTSQRKLVDRSALYKELGFVLGHYTPGGVPTVFVHASANAEIVKIHEESHRDLTRNTCYGWLVQVLMMPEPGNLLVLDDRLKLASQMIQRAWTVFEGHATWGELLALAKLEGVDRAFESLHSLPRDYRAAVGAFAGEAALKVSDSLSLPILGIVTAMAEYAMDRRLATKAPAAGKLEDLIRQICSEKISPDEDLDEVYSIVLRMNKRDRGAMLSAALVRNECEFPVTQDLQQRLTVFRNGVEELKLRLWNADTFMRKKQGDANFLTADGRATLFRGFLETAIPNGSFRGEVRETVLPDDSVIVWNHPSVPIELPRLEVTLEQLPLMPMSRFDLTDTVVVCAPVHGILRNPDWVACKGADEIDSLALIMGAARIVDGAVHHGLEVICVRLMKNPVGGFPSTHACFHGIAYLSHDQLVQYLEKLSSARPNHSICLLGACVVAGKFFVQPSPYVMPCVVNVHHYGLASLKHIVATMGEPDYLVVAGLNFLGSIERHALVVGQNSGLRFVMVGVGPPERASAMIESAGLSDKLDIEPQELDAILVAAALDPIVRGVPPREENE